MTEPTHQTPLRDDPATMTCPVCHTQFTPVGRQSFCGTPCRKTAYRRRHLQPAATITIPAALRRRDHTIYECPDCGQRLLGEQRCEDCGRFARSIGVGGPCPNCDDPVAVRDLLDQEVTVTTR